MQRRARQRTFAAFAITALTASGLAVAAQAPSQAAQPGDINRFDTWVGYDVGLYPSAAAMADFNGDGRLDVAWGMDAWSPNTMSVSLNLGDGTLAPAVAYESGDQTEDLQTADLDGDGDVDLVGAGKGDGGDNLNIDVWLNAGDGTFAHTGVEAGKVPTNLALADLDGDGDIDVVMANQAYNVEDPDQGGIGVLLNNGDATFASEVNYQVGPQTYEVVLADFDGDEILDAAATNYDFEEGQPHRLSVLTGNGDGTFNVDETPQVVDGSIVGGWGQAAMDAGDLDGDGDADLAVGGTSSYNDAVLTNDGTGEFTVDATYDVFGALDIHLVDADTDGDLDVLSVGGGGGTAGGFMVQRNNGDGTLAAPETGTTSNNPLGLAVGDLSGDGRVDLAIANRDTATGATHLQREDGTFSSPPTASQFTPSKDIATADFDGDGDTDVAASGQDGFKDVIWIYQNDGTGALTESGFVRWEDSLSRDTTTVTAGDLDGDSDPDLTWMVGGYSQQRVVQALNNGDGTFATPTARTIDTCTDSMVLADLDADGDLDEVFGNEDGCGDTQDDHFDIAVSFNDGAATFANDIRIRMSWANRALAVLDADLDGDMDIVSGGVENFHEGEPTGDISIAYGDGTGAFTDGAWLFTGAYHFEFAVGDFEGDGDLDIASNSAQDGTTLLVSDGAGSFADSLLAGEYIHGYTNAVGIAAGDVDGDTILDIVVAHVTGSDVGIHTGFGDATFEPRQVRYGLRPRVSDVELADLNGDGLLDIVSPSSLGGGGASTDGTEAEGDAADAPGVLVLHNRKAACTIKGTAGNDVLRGKKGTDVICGLGGNDVIKGVGGGDILRGGPGNDKLIGGDGIDVLDGEQGTDLLKGGAQDDKLRGSTGSDDLRGGGGRDVIDLLDGTKGNDKGNGGSGRDHCRSDARDTITKC